MNSGELFDAIRRELIENKIRHVQALFKMKDARRCIKFVSVDTDRYKSKVKEIASRYPLELKYESKTTLTYFM